VNAIVVLNVGGRSLHPKSRASFVSAAKRWGVEFVEILKPLAPIHHFWQKAFAIKSLQQFDRVIQMDADMLIRWDAPSPFDLVPRDHIGVVSSRQFTPPPRDYAVDPLTPQEGKGIWISRHRDRCIQSWARRMGMKPCHDSLHLNGGLFLYSPSLHRDLFAMLRDAGEKAGWTPKLLPEQAALSVLLFNLRPPQTWLPHTWNIVAAHQRHIREEYCTGIMNGYVYHFTGHVERGKRIANTAWEKRPCDEIAERLNAGDNWAEVGVADGYNALGVLTRVKNTKAILVDAWRVANEQYKKSGDLAARLTKEQWGRVYDRACRLTAPYAPTVIRERSDAAAPQVADASLDLVYIDAEHTYDAVKADVLAWLPKVKDGGWIGGHDYNHPNEARGKLWGVKSAVDKLLGGAVELGACHTWFCRVTPETRKSASKSA
jgi:hypothetical protein